MTDIVMCSKRGHLPPPGEAWRYPVFHRLPVRVEIGDRLYLVHDGALWGFGQICMKREDSSCLLTLGMGAPRMVTLPCQIKNFGGFRYRWWDRIAEQVSAA